MFDDLDASLAALLADGAAPPEVRTADVSFAMPDKDYQPGQPTLNLFLHEVQENRALRDDAPILQRVPPGRLTPAPAVAGRLHLPGHRLVPEHRRATGGGRAPAARSRPAVAGPLPVHPRQYRAGR